MKKNICINLFGTLYAIDEDAYQLLERYIENMKSFFSNREGGEEIADDIEHRVAEHLWDLKESGVEAISIEMVKDIINQIGNPEEINDEPEVIVKSKDNDEDMGKDDDDDPDFDGQYRDSYKVRFMKWFTARGLYRDPQDKLIGGVASGFSHFIGVLSPLVCRILFAVLPFITNGWFVLVYILLWIITPQARTAEQRLHMKGKAITPENINDEIVNGMATDAEVAGETSVASTKTKGCLASIVSAIVAIIKCALILAFIFMFMVVVAAIVPLCIFTYNPGEITRWTGTDLFEYAATLSPQLVTYAWITVACALIVTLIPLCGLIRMMRKTEKPLSTVSVVTFVVTWCIALAVGIVTFAGFCRDVENADSKQFESASLEARKHNTRNGIFLDPESWKYLDFMGMELLQFENGETYLVGDKEYHPLGMNRSYLRLVQKERFKDFKFHAQTNQTLEAGNYMFEALVWNAGSNNAIYIDTQGEDSIVIRLGQKIQNVSGDKTFNLIPLREITWEESRLIPLLSQVADSTAWENCKEMHGHWCYVSQKFRHEGGEVKVGIRNGLRNDAVYQREDECFMGVSEMSINKL